MTEKLKQTIQEEVMKLPKEKQEAIDSFDWPKIAEDIGKKYLLDESEINNFQVETLLVLVGITDPTFFPTNIENQVETTKDEATEMAKEVYEKIFVPISKKIEENTKDSLKSKSPNWKQSLDFILSGGDYSALIGPTQSPNSENNSQNEEPPRRPPTLQDIKDKLLIDRK